jgi:hypothetical protein
MDDSTSKDGKITDAKRITTTRVIQKELRIVDAGCLASKGERLAFGKGTVVGI